MQKNKYTKDCLYVICLLVDGGFNTYGGFTGEQLEAKALIYSTILLEDADMDNEIIKLTGMRYLKGEVTVYRDGCHVPVSQDFPTAPEFYQACKQTYAALYRNIVIGETERDGITYAHTLKVRRDLDPNTLETMVNNERRRLGLRIEQKSKPLSHDQERKASEIIRRVFGDTPKLNKDGQE